MSRSGYLKLAGVAAVVVLVATAVANARRAAEWEAEAQLAIRFTAEAVAESDTLRVEKARLVSVNDSLARAAAEIKERVVTKVIELEAEPVPEDCEPYTTPRDTIIAEALQTIDTLEAANDTINLALDLETEAHRITRTALDSVTTTLERRPRPGFTILPEIGIFAGGAVTPAGFQPAVGVGLVWRL